MKFLSDIKIDPVTGKFSRPMTSAEENELAARIKKGNRAAKALLLRMYKGFVVNTCSKLVEHLVDTVDFDDVLQEAHMAILAGAKSFDPTRGARLSTFLRWRIRNRVLTWERDELSTMCGGRTPEKEKETNRDRRSRERSLVDPVELIDENPRPDEAARDSALQRELKLAMKRLRKPDRFLIRLRILKRLSKPEVSRRTGLRVEKIDWNIARVLAELRRKLK